MLPSTSDYALRAILVLARTPAGEPVRPDELARLTSATPNDLRVTLDVLAEAGILQRQVGAATGYVLAVPAEQLSLARIVDCFQDGPPPECAPGAATCDPLRPCAAHDGWPKLVAARRQMLSSTTVADVIAGGRTVEQPAAERTAVPTPARHRSTIAWGAAAAIRRHQFASETCAMETRAMAMRLHDPSRHSVPRLVSTIIFALTALLVALSLAA